jgi:hypothetical protein
MNEYLGNIKLTQCKNEHCENIQHVFFVVTAKRTAIDQFEYFYYGYFGGRTFQYLRGCVNDINERYISESVKKKLRKRIAKLVAISSSPSTYQTYIKFNVQELSLDKLIEWINDSKTVE